MMNRDVSAVKSHLIQIFAVLLASISWVFIHISCTNNNANSEPPLQSESDTSKSYGDTSIQNCKDFYGQYITIASSTINCWETYLMLLDTGFFNNQTSSEKLYAQYFSLIVMNSQADLGMAISESTSDMLTQNPNLRKEYFGYLECLPNKEYLSTITLYSIIDYMLENCYNVEKFQTEYPWLATLNNIQYFNDEKERFMKQVPGYCD